MCGIVGAVAERNVVPLLMEGLRRLEYRGYDSAGLAVLNGSRTIERRRTVGKVSRLQDTLDAEPLHATRGIAHTRWATHGSPSERNAHPHVSGNALAIVHNGIIENHETLRAELTDLGYKFDSETDTEVVAHRIHHRLRTEPDLLRAVSRTVGELEGAYALAVLSREHPDRIVVARAGCPVVLGLGIGENYVASDVSALLPVTRQFVFLEEGDVAELTRDGVRVLFRDGRVVERPMRES
jgi:glucosamine--fructose-6-phosphate aminotransferase (isomerizing)